MDKKTYLQLIGPAIDLVAAKHEDYNEGIELLEYFPFGDYSYIQMLHVKLLRLRSIAVQETTNFETAKDTLLDLINYAVFYLEYLEGQHE